MDLKSFNDVRQQLNFTLTPWPVIRHLIFDALLIAGVYYCFHRGGVPETVLGIMLLPILFFNGFALMHEAVHSTISRNPWVNDLVGVIGGALCFLPYEPWKIMHIEHHQWAGNVDRDPVNKLRKDYNPEQRTKNLVLSIIWRSWLPILALMQHIVFWSYPLQKAKIVPTDLRGKLSFAASFIVPALLYVGVPFLLPGVFKISNFGPAIFAYLVLVEFVNLPHHLELPTFGGKTRLPIMEQHQIARSAIYPVWFSKWVLLNFNLHLEHHLYPTLPWHELQKARVLVRPLLGSAYNETYGGVWLWKNRNQPIGNLLARKDAVEEHPEEKIAA